LNPLEGIEGQPVEIQISRLVGAIRTLTNTVGEHRQECQDRDEAIRDEVKYMKHALWGLVFTVIGGMMLFLFSVAAGWLGAT
jgi:hypothetical protein